MSAMLAQLPIHGITIRQDQQVLHIQSREKLSVLSTSFFGAGFLRVNHILNAYVSRDYDSDDPAGDLHNIAIQNDVPEPFVGLLTAVPLRKARMAVAEEDGLRVAAVATAGVGNATNAGVTQPWRAYKPGTINLILLLDAQLSQAAMLNAIITATEAKCAVLRAMDIRTADGEPATGTSTDTVTIACTGQGTEQAYAGPATVLGWLIAKAVRQAVEESLLAA
jgi:adenosylcobinamide hydrolase